jgi:hypothetical protein
MIPRAEREPRRISLDEEPLQTNILLTGRPTCRFDFLIVFNDVESEWMGRDRSRRALGIGWLTAPACEPIVPIPLRAFGSTGLHGSALGVGGHHLGEIDDQSTAVQAVHEGLDGGVTFFR